MSMHDYGINDYGYVFTDEMIDRLIEKECPNNIDPGNTYAMANLMGLEYIGEFSGEVYHLDENGDDDLRRKRPDLR